MQEFTDLPLSFREAWEEHKVELLSDFVGKFKRPWILRCQRHHDQCAILDPDDKSLIKDNSATFLIDEWGKHLSQMTLATHPVYLQVNNYPCRACGCEKPLKLFNAVLEVMECAWKIQELIGVGPNVCVVPGERAMVRAHHRAQCSCVCGSVSVKHKCGGCRAVRYCSQACQSVDWANHKFICRALQQLRE